jgi:exopolyphosphatase / guanosine-5'-triphosphate,3'-diphosphate pyrophosphatase
MDKIAIIDLGTNTFHLLVAEWKDDGYAITYQEKLPAKIGVGGINQSLITPEAIERSVAVLQSYQQTLVEMKITQVMAFGTSALRNASNQVQVIKRIREATGIDVKIISGDEEAELIYKGVRAAVALGKEKSLMVDIGGGSVEFIIGSEKELFWKQSFEIGGQRLLEKFQHHDPILNQEVQQLNQYLDESLSPLWEVLKTHQPKSLVGSSGTFDTLSEIYCFKNNILQEQKPETPLTITAFNEIFEELLLKNREERMQISGMIELRVDMIVVACCLIDFVLKKHRFETIRVSAYSLKEGVLYDFNQQLKTKQ